MNKLLIFLLSLCVTGLEAATITNWGAQLPTAVPASGDVILMQKGGITYYFTPNQLATQLSTNANLAVAGSDSNALYLIETTRNAAVSNSAIANFTGRGTNTTIHGLTNVPVFNRLVINGDSLSTEANGNWGTILTNGMISVTSTVYNATSGRGVIQLQESITNNVLPLNLTNGDLVTVWIGANDYGLIGYGVGTPASLSEWTNRFDHFCKTVTSNGATLVVLTITPRASRIPQYTNPMLDWETNRTVMNNYIRSYTNAYVVDLANLVNNPFNTNILHDGSHFTLFGLQLIARAILGVLQSPKQVSPETFLTSFSNSVAVINRNGSTIMHGDDLGTYFGHLVGIKAAAAPSAFWTNRINSGVALQIGLTNSDGKLAGDNVDSVSLGGSFSGGVGAKPKLMLYDDGLNKFGFGISAQSLESQFDHIINATNWDYVWYSGAATNELMRLKGTYLGNSVSGNLGVGYRFPSNKVTVAGNASIGLNYAAVFAPANGLTVEGNVGIGTNGAGARLHVQSGSADGAEIRLQNTASSSYPFISLIQPSRTWMIRNNGTVAGAFEINDTIANEVRLTIDTSGNVGIGTRSPLNTLHVAGGIVQTNGGIWQTWSLGAPSAPATQGAVYWNDGTNICAVFRNAGGALSTNKLSMTAWP